MIDLTKTNHKIIRQESAGKLSKYWVELNGQEYLFKSNYMYPDATTKTNFGEVLYSRLGKRLGFECVDADFAYAEIDGEKVEGVLVKSFYKNINEDHMLYKEIDNVCVNRGLRIMNTNDVDNCTTITKCFAKLMFRYFDENKFSEQILKMAIVDHFLGQGDRHNGNIAYIFDINNNMRLAPCFDNGHCLGFRFLDFQVDRYFREVKEGIRKLDYMGDTLCFNVHHIDYHQKSFLTNTSYIAEIYKTDSKMKQFIDSIINLDIKKEIIDMTKTCGDISLSKNYIKFATMIFGNRVSTFEKVLSQNTSKNLQEEVLCNNKRNNNMEK